MEAMLDHATKRENRLTKIEGAIASHDKLMTKVEKSLSVMIGWFMGLTCTIIGGMVTAGLIVLVHWK